MKEGASHDQTSEQQQLWDTLVEALLRVAAGDYADSSTGGSRSWTSTPIEQASGLCRISCLCSKTSGFFVSLERASLDHSALWMLQRCAFSHQRWAATSREKDVVGGGALAPPFGASKFECFNCFHGALCNVLCCQVCRRPHDCCFQLQ